MAGMIRFDRADPLSLDDQLSDDERLIRETARLCARAAAVADRRGVRTDTPRSSARRADWGCLAQQCPRNMAASALLRRLCRLPVRGRVVLSRGG